MRPIWQQLLDRLGTTAPVIYAFDMRPQQMAQWEEILSLGLLRELELMDIILCEDCGEGHWANIFWIEPGVQACFGCPEAGVITVGPEKLRKWHIDSRRVAALVAEALDVDFAGEGYLSDRLWRLGRRRIGGQYREIFFGGGMGLEAAEISSTIQNMVGRAPALVFHVRRQIFGGQNEDINTLPTGHHFFGLDSVSAIRDARLMLDFDYVEERLIQNQRPGDKNVVEIPAPPGTGWKDVSILLYDGMMQATVSGRIHEKEFDELGVAADAQNVQVLRLFAAARGSLSADSIAKATDGLTPTKKKVGRLRDLLRELFGIDGDPIPNNRKADSYSCAFRIRLGDDLGYPTPNGSGWVHFSFHERDDGRLVVSTGENKRRRGYMAGGDGAVRADVAEESQEVFRTYTIEDITPRSLSGKLPAEGVVLQKLLRAGGQLNRRADDIPTLKLARRLMEWTGISQPPFSFSPPRDIWVASFSCSSAFARIKS